MAPRRKALGPAPPKGTRRRAATDRFGRRLLAILGRVGFNPYRARRRSYADHLFVVAGLLVTLALVAWALFG